jgi:DNA-binding XRE family transcriptional regulator
LLKNCITFILIEKLAIGMKMLNLPEIVTKEDEDNFFKNISFNVKRIRKMKKMSQLEVALSIGQQSSGFYASIENYSHGKHFNLRHLLRLSKLFEVPIEEFFKSDT